MSYGIYVLKEEFLDKDGEPISEDAYNKVMVVPNEREARRVVSSNKIYTKQGVITGYTVSGIVYKEESIH